MNEKPQHVPTLEEIQWRNIKKVVRAIADLCFESKDHPQYGTCHLAVVNSLTAKDGLGHIELEPLVVPTVPAVEHLKPARRKL